MMPAATTERREWERAMRDMAVPPSGCTSDRLRQPRDRSMLTASTLSLMLPLSRSIRRPCGRGMPSDATFAPLTRALERGQAAGDVRPGSVLDQALAAWAVVHASPPCDRSATEL